jgi:N-acetylmuramoyl-L-alanine amidase
MSRRLVPATVSLGLVLLTLLLVWLIRPDLLAPRPPITTGQATETPDDSEAARARLALISELSPQPDWQRLDAYQNTITRAEFLRLLENVFTVSDKWKQVIEVDEAGAAIHTGRAHTWYRLAFAIPGNPPSPVTRFWKPASALAPAPADQPLAGVHIAIDAGHLGGDFARLEERWFRIGSDRPVTEGDMTLQVAHLLRPRLEALGASVTLVRETPAPVTKATPETFLELAHAQQPPGTAPDDRRVRLLAERLFYRTSEIRARAQAVNQTIRPDLVLCLHFNAEGWGPDPANPVLSANNHFHALVNGAYTDEEVLMPDQRFEMMLKILQGTHAEETALAIPVADSFLANTGLPPYRYEPTSSRARNIANNPYIWARNLLANRTYECPVVFLEPYVMNSSEVYARIQAGDYDGLREINGRRLPSIFREYADATAAGIAQHYRRARAQPN